MAVQGMPAFAEDTLQGEWTRKILNAPVGRRHSELGSQMRIDLPNIITRHRGVLRLHLNRSNN